MILRLTADGSHTLYSQRYQQTYHSNRGAVTESRHVFLAASGVAGRLRAGLPTRVLEVGLGSGLNFLLTADLARHYGVQLDYLALEREPPATAVIKRLAYHRYLEHPEVLEEYLRFHQSLPIPPADGRYQLEPAGGQKLELRLGEATKQRLPQAAFHAIYQDAFSPDSNPELWSTSFLGALRAALADGGKLSSYCVKGAVRRRLQSLGFAVSKRPGPPGGKREMLVATVDPSALR